MFLLTKEIFACQELSERNVIFNVLDFALVDNTIVVVLVQLN